VNAPLADTLGRRTSGVRESADFGPSIDWALAMFPDTKRVILVEDSTDTGQTNSAEFIALAAKSYPKLEIVRTQAMSFEQLQNTLYTPQENTIAFFNAFWRDSSGANISVNELSLVFQHASVPVFGRSQWMMGLGLVGGLCVIGQDQGRAMAQLLFDYLSTGQFKPGAQDSPNRFMVDWLQLKKFSGQPALVPHNAILLNKPEPFVKRYGPVLIPLLLTIIVILTATILLALLSIKLRAARNTAAASLAEKEILLKEVHHRVKNNLQVMKSLFNLQRRGTDPILEAAFNSASNRLHAMATVHDHLYRDGMFSSIDLVAYANDMADEIKGVYAQSLHNCQIAVIGGFVQLGIDHAVPVGLFLNEALTNAVKYAPVDAAHPLEVHI
ncbi:MAG TPA: sensor histidine kinase, partial [Spirochaetales bacterium]|nr:sensor histidine kinase [Spirochaetales bacterium]